MGTLFNICFTFKNIFFNMKFLSLLTVILIINGYFAFKLTNQDIVNYAANRQAPFQDANSDDMLYAQTLKLIDSVEYPDENYLTIDPSYYDDDDEDSLVRTHHRNIEMSPLNSLGDGFQYIQGGAGKGEQHLQPDGSKTNFKQIKTDEKLPAYCQPPNPCPVGYTGSFDECNPMPFHDFTAQFSKKYQSKQACMCDSEHNNCQVGNNDLNSFVEMDDSRFSGAVAKKSPRRKRSIHRKKKEMVNKIFNPYLNGEPILYHVAKKISSGVLERIQAVAFESSKQ